MFAVRFEIQGSRHELDVGALAVPYSGPRLFVSATTLEVAPPVAGIRRDSGDEAIDIEELSASSAPDWDSYVHSRPEATCYHLLAWQRVASRAYRLATPFLIARGSRTGRVRGVLPLFVVENILGGYLTTGLFGAYGPVLADSNEVRRRLLDHALAQMRARRLSYFVHKSVGDEALPTVLRRHDPCVVAVLPLASPDVMWKGFRSEIRNRIRKAERSGMELRTGFQELPSFYDVLAESMHRKGTPIYGFGVMRELVAAQEERAEVLTLWKEGAAVCGALVLYHNDTVLVPFVSARASSFQLCPNNLIYWKVIQRGWARGMRRLDFGRSFRSSSNLDFKQRWGAETIAQPFYVYSADGRQPHLDTGDRAVRALITLWKSVPLPVANALGPSLCRSFLV
jgi:FemAB-related protein (PEP-CTERM system-associated)